MSTLTVPAAVVPVALPTRLTRRGRFVAALAVLVLAISAWVGLAGPLFATPEAPSSEPTVMVVVRPGQTLWGIAGQIAPGRDRRAVIGSIMELNALESPQLTPGQHLLVPQP